MRRFLFTMALILASAGIMNAHSDADSIAIPAPLRPVTSAYTLEVGSADITDTYLSPLGYTGQNAAFSYERHQAMKFNPEKWIMQLRLTVGFDHTENPAKNADIWGFGINATWGMMRRWNITDKFRLAAGGSTSLNAGGLYSTRNGNNPVSAKASWTVNLTGMATYGFKIGSRQVTLRYQPTLPLTGIFFAPEYGQLYYELYRGDTSGTVHAVHPWCYFHMDNLLTADIRLGATALRLGYHGTITSTKAHHIVCNMTTHSFVIGISGEWLSLSPGNKLSSDAKIISAYY